LTPRGLMLSEMIEWLISRATGASAPFLISGADELTGERGCRAFQQPILLEAGPDNERAALEIVVTGIAALDPAHVAACLSLGFLFTALPSGDLESSVTLCDEGGDPLRDSA
jgi:hypothetical protein